MICYCCCRQSSQKPSIELQKSFKPYLEAIKFNPNSPPTSSAAHANAPSLNALDVATLNPRQFAEHHNIKDADPTPRASSTEQWNFGSTGLTPSVLDPNSSSFNTFANQMPGYYTPTPGGTNTLYHPQAGDLHTPGFGLGLNTPLSMSTSDTAALHAPQLTHMHSFAHAMQHHHHMNPFGNPAHPFQMHHQPTFPPHNFQHQGPLFEQLDSQAADSPMCGGDMNLDVEMSNQTQMEPMFQPQLSNAALVALPQHPSSEKSVLSPPFSMPCAHNLLSFRYRVTLNAPTAMVRSADEIPITYLNKGQAYTLNVHDTAPQHSVVGQLKYRTFVRVSFEEDSQRQRPGACWQLWKEGRGTNEAHQRGGRLQAVEFVDQNQSNDLNRPKLELESSSFDGFCVTWSPSPNAQGIECPISVRFNFLSTDFSHSKGVKGIPVRLCTKTELLLDSMSPSQQPAHEVCYCKVKLFRDHGAERKLSNDVAHVKKLIDKMNQQISQIESGMRDSSKRKRSGSISKVNAIPQRPGKVPKHKRTWSMSSTASTGRSSAEEDLQMKLIGLQDMFGSTRPISVLFLRGAEEDDPDLHPVSLSGDSQGLTRVDTSDTNMWDGQSNKGSSAMVSPTPSNQSLPSNFRRPSAFGPPSRVNSNEWGRSNSQVAPMDLKSSNPQHLASPPDQPVKMQAHSPTGGTLSGWFEAIGVDSAYQPPPERANKPLACFYLQPRVHGKAPEDNYYRAVYLLQRNLNDFVSAAAVKFGIEPQKIVRTVRINPKGIQILMDDEAIRELPEGQDMKAEFAPVDVQQNQWHSRPNASSGYELRLVY
ncbi:hypothetical protein D6D01_04869 [Aureobasidium pullulans]|uniref:Grh/CP2 DB domain-containing protein n=1 Tax=Aureobasidium pullulans TaxID=5580 RepID=A0A4S9L987_AURPU|nr:hypothetical protein D6D01_04869 [Aureobasidium pullulans]